MSADLERLAQYYAQQGDTDLEGMLKIAADVSRRRDRAERIVHPEEPPSDETIERRRDMYYHVQMLVLDTLVSLAPRQKGKKYSSEDIWKVMRQFGEERGKYLPDEVLVSDLVMPLYDFSTILSPVQDWEVRNKMHLIDSDVRRQWNRTFHQIEAAFHFERRGEDITIGEFREMPDPTFLKLYKVGSVGLQTFRIAISSSGGRE